MNEICSKFCAKCKYLLPLSAFNKNSKARDGLQHWCVTCSRAAQKVCRERNKGDNESYMMRYVRKMNARGCTPEALLAFAPAMLEQYKAWAAANPLDLTGVRRKDRERAAVDPTADPMAIASVYEDARLAEQFTGKSFAVDHIIPLSRGGKHHESNLRHLSARLNSIKGAKLDNEVTDAEFRQWVSGGNVFE